MKPRAKLTAQQKAAAALALSELRRLDSLHNGALLCALGVHEIIDYYSLPIEFGPLYPDDLPDAMAELSELIRAAETIEAAPAPLKAVA